MRAQGLEPWTYGLKERCPDVVTGASGESCDNVDSVVATLVATETADSACEPVIIPDDLRALIEL